MVNTRKRILIVDDDERVLYVLRRALTGLGDGYEIVTAEGGREALLKAGVTPFDLLITDLRMTDMGGIELTEGIKALNAGTVVVWVTAYGSHRVADEAGRLSVYRCLDKPLKVAEIRGIVREALESTDSLI
jgi:DNA-binding NtrC family response regulator